MVMAVDPPVLLRLIEQGNGHAGDPPVLGQVLQLFAQNLQARQAAQAQLLTAACGQRLAGVPGLGLLPLLQ